MKRLVPDPSLDRQILQKIVSKNVHDTPATTRRSAAND
jgi:hypothetical protein